MDLMVEVNTRPGIKFLKEAPHICGCHQIVFEFIVECETRNMSITTFQWSATHDTTFCDDFFCCGKRKKETRNERK